MRIAPEHSIAAFASQGAMRAALSFLVAAILLSPAIVVTVRAPSSAKDPSVDGGPDLMPPQPGVQSWPRPRTAAAPIRSPGPTPTTGTSKVLVLLVDFTDVTHDASHTPAFMDGVFNDVSPGARSLRAYYSEVSYGALTIQATVPGYQSLTADGVQVDGYTMVSESSPVGVVAHEFGHDLGLPDLYDT